MTFYTCHKFSDIYKKTDDFCRNVKLVAENTYSRYRAGTSTIDFTQLEHRKCFGTK